MTPKSKASCWITVLVSVAFTLLSAGYLRVSAQQLSHEDLVLATHWLLSNCGLGEGNQFTDRMRARAAQLVPYFAQAAQNGPDADAVTDLERAAATRYEQRQAALSDPSNTLRLNQADLKLLRGMSRDQFVTMEKNNFTIRYKAQAIAGLALLGGSDARATLQKIARDKNSPVQSNAREALAKFRNQAH